MIKISTQQQHECNEVAFLKIYDTEILTKRCQNMVGKLKFIYEKHKN